MTVSAIRKKLKDFAAEQGGYRYAAPLLEVSVGYLGFVITGQREPGPKILAKLGIERIITPRRVSYRSIEKA